MSREEEQEQDHGVPQAQQRRDQQEALGDLEQRLLPVHGGVQSLPDREPRDVHADGRHDGDGRAALQRDMSCRTTMMEPRLGCWRARLRYLVGVGHARSRLAVSHLPPLHCPGDPAGVPGSGLSVLDSGGGVGNILDADTAVVLIMLLVTGHCFMMLLLVMLLHMVTLRDFVLVLGMVMGVIVLVLLLQRGRMLKLRGEFGQL